MDTNLPTPYTPLDVLVARCRLPISVGMGGWNPYWIIWNQSGSGHPSMTYGDAWASTRAYTALRDRLMAERGQITDQVV